MRARADLILTLALALAACQNMDRVERPSPAPPPERSSTEGRDEAGTRLEETGVAALPTGGPGVTLTASIALEWLGQIEAARSQERLDRIEAFVAEFPRAQGIWELHVLSGEAYQDLGRPEEAAEAFQRAILFSGTDLLELPVESDLAYRVGWAHYQAGQVELGRDWLVRTTFISDRPQLEEALRYVHGEWAAGQEGLAEPFREWLSRRRRELAVTAPDFELPAYRGDPIRLGGLPARVVVLNFWTPT